MTHRFLSVTESAEFTNTSVSTIKRLIRELRDDEHHADRDSLRPSFVEWQTLKDSGARKFKWRLAKPLLEKRFEVASHDKSSDSAGESRESLDDRSGDLIDVLQRTIETLQKQLNVKDQQLATKDDQIKTQEDLVKSFGAMTEKLQNQLFLQAGTDQTKSGTPNEAPIVAKVTKTPGKKNQPTKEEKGIAEERQKGKSFWKKQINLPWLS